MMTGTLSSFTLWLVGNVLAIATRASDTIGPATGYKVGSAVIGIREVDDCFLKCLWFLFHTQDSTLNGWSCQVYYYPTLIQPISVADRSYYEPFFNATKKEWQNLL